jgi:hypothetical protein
MHVIGHLPGQSPIWLCFGKSVFSGLCGVSLFDLKPGGKGIAAFGFGFGKIALEEFVALAAKTDLIDATQFRAIDKTGNIAHVSLLEPVLGASSLDVAEDPCNIRKIPAC